MPKLIPENEIESIISNFNADIVEYEIIDMEKYKGWSSEYLYLVVSAADSYVLKAKTPEQTLGYDNEVKISTALLANNIQARRPIFTKNNTIFHEQGGYFWCLMTYIPGTSAHVNEYTKETIKSLAEHLDQYINASISNDNLKNLDIKTVSTHDGLDILDRFINEKKFLEEENILPTDSIEDLYLSIKKGHASFLDKVKITSLLHNDINPGNILIDHKTRNVISFIDWDHVCYGNPLKDVSDAVAIFYDYLMVDKAAEYKEVFYTSLAYPWFKKIDLKTVEFAFFYYYTVAKWRAILFYLDLYREYGNRYGEQDRFIAEIQTNYSKWFSIVSA